MQKPKKSEAWRERIKRLARDDSYGESLASNSLSSHETSALIQELEILKHELAAQNEELRQGQLEIEKAKARFEILYNHSPAGYLTIDASGRILEANTTACNMFGQDRTALIGRHVQSLLTPGSADELHLGLQSLTAGKERDLRQLQVASQPGRFFQTESVILALPEAETVMLCLVTDRTEREHIKTKLADTAEWLRLALKAGQSGVWEWNMDTGRNTWSDELWNLYMLDRGTQEASFDLWQQSIAPEDRVAVGKEVLAAAAEEREINIEWRVNSPNGQERWLMSRGQPRRGPDGHITSYVGVVVDITPLKQMEENLRRSVSEKNMLLKEVHHRVKNNLQVLSSLISLQINNLTGDQDSEAFYIMQNRVHSIALVHERVYHSDNLSAVGMKEYITELVLHIDSSYAGSGKKPQLCIDIEDITLGVDKSIPLGLLLNELVGNAYKHAFRVGVLGKLGVSMSSPEGTYTVAVEDNGPGVPDGFNSAAPETMGMQLIKALVGQLGGSLSLKTGEGTRWEVTFPG